MSAEKMQDEVLLQEVESCLRELTKLHDEARGRGLDFTIGVRRDEVMDEYPGPRDVYYVESAVRRFRG